MTIKRNLLSSATALVAIMALAGSASAQADREQAGDALQQDQQAAIGECDLTFEMEAIADEAVADDLRLMRDSALRLEEYGKIAACNEVAMAIREILDDPQQAEDLAATTGTTDADDDDLEVSVEAEDDEVAEAPAEPADEEADLAQADTAQPEEAEADDTGEIQLDDETADTEAAELDEPAADDAETAEIDVPAAIDDEDTAELDEPAADDAVTAEADEDVGEEVAETERPTETYLSMQEDEDVLASELMGVYVENPEGESLGSISDVIIHDEIGVKAVVIGVGGFLGIGQKKVAVNYNEIEHRRDENGDVQLVFSATREQLDEAPEFQTLRDQIAEAEMEQMEMQQETQQPAQPLAPAD